MLCMSKLINWLINELLYFLLFSRCYENYCRIKNALWKTGPSCPKFGSGGKFGHYWKAFFLSSLHRKIRTFKSVKGKCSLIRAVLLPQNDLSVSCTVQKRVPVNVSPMKNLQGLELSSKSCHLASSCQDGPARMRSKPNVTISFISPARIFKWTESRAARVLNINHKWYVIQ